VLRFPRDRQLRRRGWDRDRFADFDLDLPVDPAVDTQLEPHLDEQAFALVFGFGGHAGQP